MAHEKLDDLMFPNRSYFIICGNSAWNFVFTGEKSDIFCNIIKSFIYSITEYIMKGIQHFLYDNDSFTVIKLCKCNKSTGVNCLDDIWNLKFLLLV